MSGSGYGVLLGDLQALADDFGTEAKAVQQLHGDVDLKPVSTGDANLDATLGAVLMNLKGLIDGTAKQLGDHGSKMQSCHDNYKSSDSDHARLLDSLMSAAN
ncbi:hypothetical protein E6W39_28400 [Kitasatospora acidiphila]|uniref:Excreted virulence factor EspC (Type VII ESX diderm) n=1 Tax=Kitasatospora acidiphila TaxID=2567942 RepID=A0A540W8S9_9ACTN|nr:DUF6317 family protein [Kitasatospora acidiphila]TQF05439.1 hypothetical protein E6W39_28400 [Kitasatospora acidiphila]